MEILSYIGIHRTTPARVDGAFVPCSIQSCENCEYGGVGDCVVTFTEWLYEDNGETSVGTAECGLCKYTNKTIHEFPCSECRRSYTDKFELNPKKTRLLEFLEHYPNAELDSNGIPKILPCRIDKTYLMKCSSSECGMCERAYWLQEVIE